MKQRILTAIAIILVVSIPVFFGGIPLRLLALFIICSTGFEWLRLQPNVQKWPYLILVAIAFVLGSSLIPESWMFGYFALGIGFFWALPVFDENFTVINSNGFITYIVLFSLFNLSMVELFSKHQYLWTIVFATYGSDTGAYFTGMKFGKHKMNPRISPKKSWEGFVGGAVFGFLISLIFSFLYWEHINPIVNVTLCLLCPVVAELGDLCFSAVKRYYKIKDFSDLLPGHGGVLDRVDSLLANILLFGIVFHIFG